MTLGITALVLFAALLHALWNALVKGASDRVVMLGLIALGHVVPGVMLVLFSPGVSGQAWPYIVASTVIHWGYYVFLNLSYRFADLSLAYPIARGAAPVLVALGAMLWAGEYLPPLAWLGILTISAGIMVLALRRASEKRALGAALATSVFIAAYSVVDGIGIRLSGSPVSYIGWLFTAEAFTAAFIFASRARVLVTLPGRTLWIGFWGGVLSGLAYALVLHAKLVTPIGIVSALRETSVIFAALIGVVFMGEGPAGRRVLAAGIVAAGIVLLAAS